MVNKICHTTPIVQALLVVKGLQGLTGAVGLLSGHTAFIGIYGGGVVLGIFGAATLSKGTVSTILQIHVDDGGGWGCRVNKLI